MGSRNVKQVILSLHKRNKSVDKLNCSPSFVDCNSEVRLRLGLKSTPKWTLNSSKVGRDLTKLKTKSKSGNFYAKTTKKRTVVGTNDTENALGNRFRSYHDVKTIRNRFSRTVIFILIGLVAFVMFLSLRDNNYSIINPHCNCNWTIDVERLGSQLRNEIFGQELAISILMNALRFHPSDVDVQYAGPLILFLHGWSGSGKTLSARILVDEYDQSGADVHWYIPTASEETKDFAKWLKSRSSDCGFHVYVLDDFDAMISSVTKYLKGITNTRNVIIITSNKGETFIADRLLEVLMRGGSRDEITVSNLVSLNPLTYFPYSELSNVVYVPFLPLERQQLRICVSKALKSLSSPVSNSTLDAVVNRTKFVPESFPVFSKTGCKRLQVV